jgi:hypothetical protein
MNQPNVEAILQQPNQALGNIDDLLKSLVMVPEKTSLEIGITLNVNGLLVTGFLISQQTYFETLMERVNSNKSASEMKTTLVDFLAQLKETLLQKTAQGEQGFSPFIHLRDAKIYPSEGKGMPTFGHALWRGDIRAVNGFSLGEMVPAEIKNSKANALEM